MTVTAIPPSGSPGESVLEKQAHRDHADYVKWTKVNALAYFGLEVLLVALLSITTLVAALGGGPLATAILSASTLFVTGVRQLFLPRERWLSFTRARDELRAALDDYDRTRGADPRGAYARLLAAVTSAATDERHRWFEVRGTQRPTGTAPPREG